MFRLLLDLLLQGLQEENVKLAMTGTTVKDKERFEEELLRVYNKLAADSSMEAIKKKRVVSITFRYWSFDLRHSHHLSTYLPG